MVYFVTIGQLYKTTSFLVVSASFHSEMRKSVGNNEETTSLSFHYDYQTKTCNQGNHSVVKTTNLFLQCRSLFKQLKSAIRPGHSHAVMYTPPQKPSHVSPLEALSEDSGPLVLAEVERTIPGSLYKLSTTSPLFEDGILGTVNVSTHYLMCKPRKLDIVLSTMKRGGDGDCLGVETIVLQSKDPHWNRRFQIFELDFGGRVTKDSTKNIQVENNGRVVCMCS